MRVPAVSTSLSAFGLVSSELWPAILIHVEWYLFVYPLISVQFSCSVMRLYAADEGPYSQDYGLLSGHK